MVVMAVQAALPQSLMHSMQLVVQVALVAVRRTASVALAVQVVQH
jgi:hypothetical protein